MLEALRGFVGGWIAKIFLGILILSFAVWGIAGEVFGPGSSNSIASVGETNVPLSRFANVYNRNVYRMSQQFGRRLTREQARVLGVERATISELVPGATLDEYARQMNVSLSDEQLAKMIAQEPAFQDTSGNFDRERFRQAVYNAQINERDFVRDRDAEAVRNQIAEAAAEGAILPKTFTDAAAAYQLEERKFEYLTITPEIAGNPPEPKDSDLKTYFEANKAGYAAPEFRKIAVLSLEPKDIANEEAVPAADVKKDYEDRIASYTTPEKRQIQQIVFTSKEKADAAKKALDEGTFFETVLKDNKVKPEDADLGMLAKTELPDKAVADAAFSLPLNEPSAVIDAKFGPIIVRVTAVQPETKRTFEEVEADIRKDLALRAASDRIIEMQQAIEDTRASGALLEDAAKEHNLTVRIIEAIDDKARDDKGNVISDLPESAKLLREVFQTNVGVEANIIDIGTAGYLWFDVLEIIPKRDRTFDEVKDGVKTDWTAAEQQKLIEAKANEVADDIRKGTAMSEAASKLGTTMTITPFIKRDGESEKLGREAIAAGYSGDKDLVTTAPGAKPGEMLVLKVADIKRPEAQVAVLPEEQIQQINEAAANDLLQQMIDKLRSQYGASVNQANVEAVLNRL